MLPVAVIDADSKSYINLNLLLSAAGVAAHPFVNPVDYFESPLFQEAHVVVVNLALPDFDGLDVLKYAIEKSKAVSVFASINAPDTQKTVAAMRCGAQSVFEKPIRAEAIISAASGNATASGLEKRNKTILVSQQLTGREQQVLQGLLANETNKEIAEKLGVSARTVETHRAKLYAKLHVNSATELIQKWKA
ncbi:MAG: hypothetical protein CMI63_17950 [Parvularcula sp.]|nr:hypothetical protein [Parvularcula sp.]